MQGSVLIGTDAALVADARPSEHPEPRPTTPAPPLESEVASSGIRELPALEQAKADQPDPAVGAEPAQVEDDPIDAVADITDTAEDPQDVQVEADAAASAAEERREARERLATDVGIPAFLIEQQAEALRKAAALRAKKAAEEMEAEARAADAELARAQEAAVAAASGLEDVASLEEPSDTLPPAPRSDAPVLDEGLSADALFGKATLPSARLPREARTLPSPDPASMDIAAPEPAPPAPPEPRPQRELPTVDVPRVGPRSMPARVEPTPWWRQTHALIAIGAVALCLATAAGLAIRSSRASEPPRSARGPAIDMGSVPVRSAASEGSPEAPVATPALVEAESEEPEANADAPPTEPQAETEAEAAPEPENAAAEGGSLGERLDSLVNAGNFYRQRSQHALARRRYEQALRIAPRDGRALYGVTRVALAQRRAADAVRHARRLVRFHPRPAHHVLLGDALRANGDLRGARGAWRNALAIHPGHRAARQRLGQ